MKLRCALCGRVTLNPAVMIGQEPIGPKCARKAGFLKLAGRRGSRMFTGMRHPVLRDTKTMDLFAGAAP